MGGIFISFEGGDGVGKSTQINLLRQLLTALGYTCQVSREPGGTELGVQVRQLLLHGGDVAPRAEALLFAADRAHHVETKIRPALERGEVFITDRYLDSSVAYQGAARSLGADQVRDLSLWATNGLLPRITILLDADPLLARQRTCQRGEEDRLEQEGDEFRRALRQQFLDLAAAEPERFAVINADQPIEVVASDIRRVMAPILQRSVIELDDLAASMRNNDDSTPQSSGEAS
ncbi:dTMP kinase [Actinomyces vulturis]|uniref:dTMP kinase n=1 Tax=Actinomyces vulturis TaxID=1857645 RepID=UPI00082E1649|nr:dTMP kinase [Actinomyces vulturis]